MNQAKGRPRPISWWHDFKRDSQHRSFNETSLRVRHAELLRGTPIPFTPARRWVSR